MQKIFTPDLDNSWYPLLGGASPPSTPASGAGILFGSGTGNIRPTFMNAQGNLERVATSLSASNTVIQAGSSTGNTFNITFATAFASAPFVLVSVQSATSQNAVARANSVTASGFTAQVFQNIATSTLATSETMSWLAIGTL
jgi:hypothetical protein